MTKKLLFAAVFCLVQSFSVMAEDVDLVPPIRPASDSRTETLISSATSTLANKVNELERRVNDLERDRRSGEDRIRQIDREVNDLKRRF